MSKATLEKLPQSEGADYFIVLDPKEGIVHHTYTADLGRSFGHDHIKDAQHDGVASAARWVVRPLFSAEPDLLKDRDEAEEFADKILDLVLGTDRHEWSSHYDRDDALAEVEDKMARKTLDALAANPPAVQPAPRLDDAWKARLLDGQNLQRDKDGIGFHPALPDFDEGVKCSDLFAALGIELKAGMAENEMDSDAYEAMTENGLTDDGDNYNAWTPKRPEGDGWNLVAVFDTEDGPACWWMRDMPFVPQRAEGYRERVDNAAVEVLCMNMKAKLAGQRAKGYRGWNNDCTQQRLSDLLRECVEKGDPVDVANFCAFLLSRGENIAPQSAPAAKTVEKSDTFGMNIGQRIQHVGGRENAQTYIEFGSVAAVRALVHQVLRDLPDGAPGFAMPALPAHDGARDARIYTYAQQPTDNVIAWRFGEACSKARPGGDYIDHGLSLLQQLQEKGYGITAIATPNEQGVK